MPFCVSSVGRRGIDASSGEHLGNLPQAFTHLALIEAVSQLIEEEALLKAC